MNLQQKIAAIFDQKTSKRNKMLNMLSLVAEDRREHLYRLLELQKSQGAKWFAPPEVVIDNRDQHEREETEI